jgi:predicted TIM-barrel fold metal-dependent hydrolase
VSIVDARCTIGDGRVVSLSPDDLVRQLDENGVAAAVVGPPDRSLAVANREGNDFVLDACRRHPDRLIGFATVNPWYGADAVAELRRAAGAGLRGLILHPKLQGFLLADTVADLVVAAASELGLPVWAPSGTPVHAMPLQLTELARRFPEVPFLMGHMGHTDFWIDAIPAVAAAPNLYAELSYKQPHIIEAAIATLGPDRCVFGSDAPFNDLRLELEKFAAAVMDDRARELVGAGTLLSLLPEAAG